jgi:flagellar motor switch protein FliN/FliY
MPQDPVPPETPPQPVPIAGDPAFWLAEEWGRQVTRAIESMTGEPALITFAPQNLTAAEQDPGNEDLLWWEQPLSLGLEAKIWVGAATGSWQEIGNRVLRSAGVDDATSEDIRSTYLEIVNQTLSGVASAVSARVQQEVSCTEGRTGPPAAGSPASSYAFEVTLGEQAIPLLAVFARSVAQLSEGPAEPVAKPAKNDRKPASSASPPEASAGSMDLLLDVELPVSVSFGRAQLMLKDVIKLTTGSIVELNRALSEPVEVIVNNCVIARGEVVVVEGNYGIRIKQVISRQERLRTLY